MDRAPLLRASDADREQAAQRLRHATTEGRLTPDELDERLGAMYASRTYGELDVLLADLPSAPPVVPEPAHTGFPRWAGAAGAVALLVVLVGALSAGVRHPVAVAVIQRRPGQFRLQPLFAEAHHGVTVAGSVVGALIVLLAGAAVVVALLRSSDTDGA